MGFWLPQTIQKRLLLCVLQKIYVLSNLDLSKLHVSLGSSSKFSFDDLILALDEINIPHLKVSSGSIKHLEIELTVSGGVSLCGKGILFEVRPLSNDPSSDSNTFSLAKSIHDLTNSIIQFSDSDSQNPNAENDLESEISNSGTTDSTGSSLEEREPMPATGALENVKNRVLNIALANLVVTFEDVKVRFYLDENNVVEATLDRVELKTEENNSRRLEFFNLGIAHFNHLEAREKENSADENMSSSVFYSPNEANSIYMSAVGSELMHDEEREDSFGHDKTLSSNLLSFNHITMIFDGLSSIEDLTIRNLKVRINECQVNLNNIFSLSERLIDFIIKSFIPKETKKVPLTSGMKGYERFRKEQDILDGFDNLFIDIDKVFINLADDISLIMGGVNYTCWENREQTLIAESFKFICGEASSECSNTPVFRTLVKADEVKIDIPHSILLTFNQLEIGRLINLYERFQKFFSLLRGPTKSYIPSRSSNEQVIVFNSKPITLAIELQGYTMFISTSDIYCHLPYNIFETGSITISTSNVCSKNKVIKIKHFSAVRSKSRIQLNSFDENFNESSLTSKIVLKIKEIVLEESYEFLCRIIMDLKGLSSYLSEKNGKGRDKKPKAHLKRSVRILQSSSIIYKQTDQASFVFILDSLDFKVLSFLNKEFGDMNLKATNILLAVKIDGLFSIHVKDITCQRLWSGSQQVLLSAIVKEEHPKPLVFLQRKSNGKIKLALRNISFHYYAKWLNFLTGLKDDQVVERPSNSPLSDKPWEVKLIDSSLVLHPYRIRPCLVVLVDHYICNGSASLSELRGIMKSSTLLLIDDFANIKKPEKRHYSSLINFYVNQGFAGVGKLDSVAVSMRRSEKTTLKIKANCVRLSLCADSAHTFVQLCMDLKIPFTFSDQEKYNLSISSPVDIFDGVDPHFFCSSHIKEDFTYYNEVEEDLVQVSSPSSDERKYAQQWQEFRDDKLNESSAEFTPSSMKLHEAYLDSALKSEVENFSEAIENPDIKVDLEAAKISIKLFDGFDWKYTRKSISNKIDEIDRKLKSYDATSSNSNDRVELAIFDSIYISGNPSDSVDLKKRVNDEIQGAGEQKNQISLKKVDLHPSRYYKAIIQLDQLKCSFASFPLSETTFNESDASAKILNKCDVSVQNFEIIDNVATSTWNKMLTVLKHEKWPSHKPMLLMETSMIRPIEYLAATELILDVNIAPLRLHVDQDTLDFLVKFGEFKDSRFELIDQYPDIPFIQKLTTNSVKLKLDYKPKKVDYSGLRSGHTSELMNFFILDGASIVLKGVALYGISGFSDLNSILKSVWTPDITSKQLPGVLQGFAPVKSILALGSGVRALVSVPLAEYKQDRRLGRSLKLGCNVFIRTATGDFVKLGAKLASGTQAVLENTEEFLGGNGSQGRLYKPNDTLMDLDGLLNEDQLVGGSNPRIKGHRPAALVIDPSKCEEGEPKIVSLYADQPLDLHQGLEEAYSSLEKHMHLVYDTFWRTKGEIQQSRPGTAAAAVSVAKVAPVAIIRPLIGATEAISKALQGISNQMDKEQIEEINDKYKPRARRN